MRNGKGTTIWINKDIHTGMYENDKAEGKGEFHSSMTNTKFYGSWHQGEMDGFGIHVDKKGKPWFVTMRMGQQVSKDKKATKKELKEFISQIQS